MPVNLRVSAILLFAAVGEIIKAFAMDSGCHPIVGSNSTDQASRDRIISRLKSLPKICYFAPVPRGPQADRYIDSKRDFRGLGITISAAITLASKVVCSKEGIPAQKRNNYIKELGPVLPTSVGLRRHPPHDKTSQRAPSSLGPPGHRIRVTNNTATVLGCHSLHDPGHTACGR